jgi:hypothetical protein
VTSAGSSNAEDALARIVYSPGGSRSVNAPDPDVTVVATTRLPWYADTVAPPTGVVGHSGGASGVRQFGPDATMPDTEAAPLCSGRDVPAAVARGAPADVAGAEVDGVRT